MITIVNIVVIAIAAAIALMAAITIFALLNKKSEKWLRMVCKMQVLGTSVKYFYYAVAALNIFGGLWACLGGLSWWWLLALPVTVLATALAITWLVRVITIGLHELGKFSVVACCNWFVELITCDILCNLWEMLKGIFYAVIYFFRDMFRDLYIRLRKPILGYLGIFKKGF